MENGRNLLRRLLLPVLVIIALWGIASIFDSSPATAERRSDVLQIQIMAKYKSLEMPPAVFMHDQHAQAVLKDGKDCTFCHESHKPWTLHAVSGLKDAKTMEQAFHGTCIGCHNTMLGADKNRGPRDGECRKCHIEQNAPQLSHEKAIMNRSLHFLHTNAKAIKYAGMVPNPDGVNCGVCHHVYDEQTKQRVWKPGAEQACSSCHKTQAHDNIPALQTAMHKSCVACHMQMTQNSVKPAASTIPALQKTDSTEAPVLQHALWSAEKQPLINLASIRLAPGQILNPDAPDQVIPPLTAPESQKFAPQAKQHPQPILPAYIPNNAGKNAAIWTRQNQERERKAAAEAANIEKEICTGPADCAGCHTAQAQAKWHKISDPPRIMRGQPDATILLPIDAQGKIRQTADDGKRTGIAPVFFNHVAHEAVTDSCTVCHHKQISACTDCHTVEGKAEGNFLTLTDVAHKKCRTCHQQKIAENRNCAGCHASMIQSAEKKSACTVCHQTMESLEQEVQLTSDKPLTNRRRAEIGEAALAVRMMQISRRTDDSAALLASIPETVKIDILADKYEPCIFAHRKVVQALVNGMQKDGLAAAFHTSTLATCAACHHNSPAETLNRPPRCASCHAVKTCAICHAATADKQPALKAAYHQQCMGCHTQMHLEKPVATDCTGCHALKAGNQAKEKL